ncbi:DinB family protein [Microbulbifer taiwanensis]|uniref:DinB family protein n=1 Tax=Microbulbifer taiwanensis TaxID=986746 RepID=A0ABW1YVI7_9GAMM|nr:DinB family protein [Microbulbifer taiwanensis]
MHYGNAFRYKKWANSELLSFGERQIHLLSKSDASYFIRILNHTAVVDSLFISRISGTQELFTADNTIETPTIPELRERMDQNDSWLVSFSESATSSDLDRKVSFQFKDGDSGQLSIDEILLHLLTHGSNHRGMASRTLASNGLERPKDTFTRFLHKFEPWRRGAVDNHDI